MSAHGPLDRTVADLMNPRVVSIGPDASVWELAALSLAPGTTLKALCRFFARASVHRAIVLDGSKLVGIVSLSDLLGYVATQTQELRNRSGAR